MRNCDECIHKAVCYRYSYGLPENYADKCGDYIPQKSGKWQRVSIDKYIQHAMAYYECSECGGQTIGEPKYCPNCGAKMVEPQGSEEQTE